MVRIGISGFGRIGRLALRRILALPDAEVVAINNRTVGEIMAHLLKYDSVHGTMKEDVAWEDGFLVIDGKKIPVISETDITKIPWGKYGADIVLECTGKFKDSKEAQAHIDNGAKKVIISAPGKMRTNTIRRSTTLFPMLPAPPTAWLPLPRYCWKNSVLKAA